MNLNFDSFHLFLMISGNIHFPVDIYGTAFHIAIENLEFSSRFTGIYRKNMDQRQENALKYLEEHGKITNSEYRDINPGISDRTALRDLEEMREKNIVVRKGAGRKTHYELL